MTTNQTDEQYRYIHGHLYELNVNEFGEKSYIHCFYNSRIRTKQAAIKAYEEAYHEHLQYIV